MIIDFNCNTIQVSQKGREFKVVGTTKIVESKMGYDKYDYELSIKFLDDNTYMLVRVDTNGKLIKMLKKT